MGISTHATGSAVLAYTGRLTHWTFMALAFYHGLGNAMKRARLAMPVVTEIVSGRCGAGLALNSGRLQTSPQPVSDR